MIKKYLVIIFLLLSTSILLAVIPDEKDPFEEDRDNRFLVVIGELGGGNMISAGIGMNIGPDIFEFKRTRYFLAVGLITGFTLLEEAIIIEPSLFANGELASPIKLLSRKHPLTLKWRLKYGYNFVKAREHNISGKAYTFGPDILFKMSYVYVIVSIPFVFGQEGAQMAPCVGTGIEVDF